MDITVKFINKDFYRKKLITGIYFLEPIYTQNKTRDELAHYAEEKVKTFFNNRQSILEK